MSYLNQLNPEQAKAVTHTEGPLLIFAGAGSGKTRVLTYRVAHLLEQEIDPYHIIAITFTNKAAKEMRERINAITPLGEQVWVSTFHSACTRILRREIVHLGFDKGFTIYDTQDTLRLIKDCLKEKNMNDTYYPPRNIAHIISTQKNNLISPREYERLVAGQFRESNIADIYELYQRRLTEMNALDFDDIIFKTVELLQNNENVRHRYQNRFRYVMVDEYQDTNHAQYKLVNLLAGYAQNLCVVGDDDQSIYGWRGANIENILQFEKDYPSAQVVKLEENYRSTKTILNAANDVISHNENRADKHLWTQNIEGQKVRVYQATTEKDEGAFVARIVKEEVLKGNAKFSDFAVLYRANAQSRSVEDALVKANISYRIFGGVKFYDRMEVKDLLAYLKAINNPADDIAHLRIINVPKRGIGQASINKIQDYARENRLSFGAAIARASDIPGLGKKAPVIAGFAGYLYELSEYAAKNSVESLIKKVIRDTEYMDTLSDGTPEGDDRIANIMELLATAKAFERDSDDTSLGQFLENVSLVADIDNYHESANAISLMTLHSAKGLEFNVVFLVGFEENIFPSYRSVESNDESVEEERRLCYVGFTRARKILYLTHAESRVKYDGIIRNDSSRFLLEVNPEHYTYVNTFGKATERRSASAAGGLGTFRPKIGKTPVASSLPPSFGKTFTPTPSKKPALDLKVGDKVRIAKYGLGEILEMTDSVVTIDFEIAGSKKFLADSLKLDK